MIHFVLPGPPVPAQRTRSKGSQHYTPRNYAEYKKALKTALYAEFGYFAWDIPLVSEKTKRRKWMDANRYKLTMRFYLPARRGDWDNLGKTVSDAIKQAGIIADDSQIDEVDLKKCKDKSNPRVEFWLERIM